MPFVQIIPDTTIEQPTVSLRWCNGVLQQAWTIERRRNGVPQSREVEWRPVPTHIGQQLTGPCPACDGTGDFQGGRPTLQKPKCTRCNGTGQLTRSQRPEGER